MSRLGNRFELRVRGPNVTPGYFGNDEANAKAFDADGFFRTGDAGCLLDSDEPEHGILFEGRVSEDFKLSSGTWVSVGTIKVNVVNALVPLGLHVAVTGHGRDAIGLLIFVDRRFCNQLVRAPIGDSGVVMHDEIRSFVINKLREYNARVRGSSSRIDRFILLADAPSVAQNEITEKGYLNQSAVLRNRSKMIDEMYDSDEFATVL